MDQEILLEVISNRRSVFPKSFTDEPIARQDLEKLLEVANTAPTHRLTEPWRFKVLTGESLHQLGDWLADEYRKSVDTKAFSQMKFDKTRTKPAKAGAVILICMQRDPQNSVPEWEEIASVACAVQNLWIAAGAMGLGGYWSSPKSISQMHTFLSLAPGERCLGLFYLGHHNQPALPKKRTPWADKVQWFSNVQQ